MTRLRLLPLSLAAIAALLFVLIALTQQRPVEHLKEVYTPSFSRVPPAPAVGHELSQLWLDLKSPSGQTFLRRLLPSQGGVLWLSLIVALVIAFDFEHLRNPRNIDVIVMQAIGLTMFEIVRFLRLLGNGVYVELMDWVFVTVFTLNVVLIVRALWRIRRPVAWPWKPALPAKALMTIAVLLLVCDTVTALVREPDDVGFFVNLGAQRLRERHRLPYGDPLLSGSPGAAYGPLLYVAHVPFQLALAPTPVNAASPDRPTLGKDSTYNLPPELATKLCTIAFHLLGVYALLVASTRLAGKEIAWALVALYCGSAYVIGVGGEDYFIGGMTYISHIAPTAVTLAAFALLPTPLLAGVALGLAAGVGFYPAFMAPAWLGYYWDRPDSRWRFLWGFGLTCLVIGIAVLLLSRADGDRGLVSTILFDTFGHHTDPRHYGFSPFSFWGQRAGIRGWFNAPLAGASGLATPMFLTFVAVVVVSFWPARRSSPQQLALLSAVAAIGASLVKIHPTGTYVAWALPFLLIGFFADPVSRITDSGH